MKLDALWTRIGAISLIPIVWSESRLKSRSPTAVLERYLGASGEPPRMAGDSIRVLAVSHGQRTLNWRLISSAVAQTEGLDIFQKLTDSEKRVAAEAVAWSDRCGATTSVFVDFVRSAAIPYDSRIAFLDDIARGRTPPYEAVEEDSFCLRYVFWLPIAEYLEANSDVQGAAFAYRKTLEAMPESDAARSSIVSKVLALDAMAMNF